MRLFFADQVFHLIWSNLSHLIHFDMIQLEPIWSDSNQIINLIQLDLIWSNLNQLDPTWSEPIRSDLNQIISKMINKTTRQHDKDLEALKQDCLCFKKLCKHRFNYERTLIIMIYVFCRPSFSPFVETMNDYVSAEKAGLHEGECWRYFKDCPQSFFITSERNKYS